ncbi:hypothetical protein BDR22DRAFT_898582 [Usnea florida]
MMQARVATRKADFDDSGSLEHCFDGMSCLVPISYPIQRLAIDAAHQSGVPHIPYFTPDSVTDVMHAHLKAESTKPVAFTSIREGIYSESFPMYTGFPDLQDPAEELKIPHNGSGPGIPFATIDDLGEATAKLVKEYMDSPTDFKYINPVMLLSGPRVWSLVDIVKLLGEIKGKDMKCYLWATSFDAVKDGECDIASVEPERLLGREPESFDETVKKMTKG